MKSYLPFLWAGLWLMGSCSTPDPDSGTDMPQPGFSVQYTLFPNPSLSSNVIAVDADASSMDIRSAGQGLPASDSGLIWHQDAEGLSMLVSQESCGVEAIWYEIATGTLLQRSALENMDPCKTEVVSVIHDGPTLYILYSNAGSEIKPAHYGLRSLPMQGGDPRDLQISETPIDLDLVSGKLQVLTHGEGIEPLSTLRTIDPGAMEEEEATPVGYDANLVLRLGMNRLLVGFNNAHMIFSGASMELVEEVRYQVGSEPGFTDRHPWASGDGSRLYFSYPSVNQDYPGDIGGAYELDRRTLVLYAFENFLDPAQMEISFDIGQATAIGKDSQNGLLLLGYEKGSDPSLGGLLRLQLEPEFKVLDQIDLPVPPFAILSD